MFQSLSASQKPDTNDQRLLFHRIQRYKGTYYINVMYFISDENLVMNGLSLHEDLKFHIFQLMNNEELAFLEVPLFGPLVAW